MRVRFRFSKQGKVCWTSHRDTARLWERAVRRAGLPVGYTSGFSPRPQVSFGLALPTGCESLAEYLELGFEVGVDEAMPPVEELPALLTPLLPQGFAVMAAGEPPPGVGSLQQEVTSCVWDLDVLGITATALAATVEEALEAPSILVRRERKGRDEQDDLRPSLLSLAVLGSSAGGTRLRAELATQPRGVRPSELLRGLRADLVVGRACRMQQWIERDGARWEPLGEGVPPVAAERALHAAERAS